MSITLVNAATAVNYPTDGSNTGTILGPSTLGYKLQIIVGNAPCLVSIATVMDQKAGPLAGYQWTSDIPIVAGNGQTVQQSFEGAVGFKAKDLIAGTHATIYAVVWEKGDPYPTDPVAAAGTLSSGGLVPPPVPVSTLNIQKDGILVGTQPTLDFEDASSGAWGHVVWTTVNDTLNTRVQIFPSIAPPSVAPGDCCSLSIGFAVSIGNGVNQNLSFNAYDFNTNTGVFPSPHSSGTQVPVSVPGFYDWRGFVEFATGGGNQRIVQLYHNGSPVGFGLTRDVPNTGDPNDMICQAIIQMAANDYVELYVLQDSGGLLNANKYWLQGQYLHA